MGKRRKKKKKKPQSYTSYRQRIRRYSPVEVFLAVLGAAIIVLVALLIIGGIFK
jgi:cell division protein FtsL